MKYEFNFAKVDVDCEAQASRILNCYGRYMIKKFGLRNYEHSLFLYCPRYNEYQFHITGLLLKVNKNLFYGIKDVFYPSCKCKELDILIRRFLNKHYKVNIYFNNQVKPKKNIYYKSFQLNFISFMRDLFFDLKVRTATRKNNIINFSDDGRNHVLIITHDKTKETDAYLNISKKLDLFFKKNNKEIKAILPFEVGLSLKDKLNHFHLIFKKLFLVLISNGFLKLSDLHFIIIDIYRNIYKKKLMKLFIENKIDFIISSLINTRYETIYYEAAKELKIKYFKYDYSLGYPIKDPKFLKYLLDTRKFSDVIFSNSKFRSEHYKLSNKFLMNPPLILPHISPQLDYSIAQKTNLKFIPTKFKVGIVDNMILDDAAINSNDLSTLLKILNSNEFDLRYILQSKRGLLEEKFKELNINESYFISGIKGDFSNLRQADLIVSLGWQSIALIAASAFEKPFIFYSKNGYPYSDHIFFSDIEKNKKMSKICKNIWMNEGNLKIKISNFLTKKQDFEILKETNKLFLNEIGFYKDSIYKYFNEYFK